MNPASPPVIVIRGQIHQPTRSVFQPKVLFICSTILLGFWYINQLLFANNQIGLDEVVYLTRNSFREIKDQFEFGLFNKRDLINDDSKIEDTDFDYPLNNMINSFFPVDSIINYNTTDNKNVTTHEIIGRYAAFSPVLNYKLNSEYKILPINACSTVDLGKEYKNKILIVLRGDCTFVDKISHILDSNLNPKSIIIANDESYRGLITMFSNNFNQDGTLNIPIMFVTHEDYVSLKKIENDKIILEVTTAYIGSWMSFVLSMILSPPLLIVIFYALILCGQKIRKRQVNIRNAKMVKSLPIFIYNIDHLISAPRIYKYLRVTGQTNMVPKDSENTQLYESPKNSPFASTTSINKIIVGGIDLRASKNSLNIITAPDDFFPAYKCSICLEKYIPLKSKVMVLDCKHFFHERCLSNWLINFKRSCPLCNTTLKSKKNYLLAGQEIDESYGSLIDLEAGQSSLFTPSQVESDETENPFQLPPTTMEHEEPETASSYFTAHSHPIEGSSRPTTNSSKRPFLINRPSEILNKFRRGSPNNNELSVSIDSGNNLYSPNDTNESSSSDNFDDSTVNLNSENV
ncbi:unnamed protein product [Candida verbasci]|uniref:RING-type domain-containing protein n=1 Tax=Candida verbasci TaxID=1227364 RepID=A0A9W4TS18_9ASCO|nr:unnamed protein product [Candida verbasci]